MEVTGDVDKFLQLCENADFSHRDEVLAGLATGNYNLTYSSGEPVPSKSMHEIYWVRARIGAERYRDSTHARQILKDMQMYVSELEKSPDERIQLWSLSFDNVSGFALVEGVNSGKILGCIYGVDKRKVSPQEWARLWGIE